MGRGTAIVLGFLGLILPGFLFYINLEFLITTIFYIFQGFFYKFTYTQPETGDTQTTLEWISQDWLKPDQWGGDIEFYVYLASFGLAVLGFIVLLANARAGGFLLLLGGLANLGLLFLMYSNMATIFELPITITGYPIPVGAIILIITGIIGIRD
ncbi:MAG: hypothetical protein ACE5I5_14630 [Candidatus Heimdallarchaeota archaeon]